jgi:hypothetical protein
MTKVCADALLLSLSVAVRPMEAFVGTVWGLRLFLKTQVAGFKMPHMMVSSRYNG